MGEQFDVIEAGGRDRRRWLGLGLLLLAGIVLVGWLATRGSQSQPEVEPRARASSTPTLAPARPNTIHPQVKRDGDSALIEVVFPDGRRADVRYPAELGLAELGVRPFQGAFLEGPMVQYRQLVAPVGGEREVGRGGQPLRNLTGNVTLWPRQPGEGSGQVLLFAFGDWRLALTDRPQGLTFDERMTWARSLTGKVTDGGFLVLSARKPLRLAEPGEYGWGREPAGPQLWFGRADGPMVVLVPTTTCQPNARPPTVLVGSAGRFTYLCRKDLYVGASGRSDWITKALNGIRVSFK